MKQLPGNFISLRLGKRSGRKKAISTVVGAVIIFVIFFTTILAYFTFEVNSRTFFEQSVNQRNQLDLVSNKEVFVVNPYPGKSGTIVANVTNKSPTTIDVVAVVVGSTTNSSVLKVLSNLNVGINSGAFAVIDTQLPYSKGQIWVKVVTNLGSMAVGIYPNPSTNTPVLNALTAGAFGDLYLDFMSYTWYTVSYCSGNSGPYCLFNPTQAFTIPSSTTAFMGFAVRVTNLNPYQLTIILDNFTQLFQFWPAGSSFRATGWFILSNQSNTILANYQPIILPYNVTKTVVFGDFEVCTSSSCTPNPTFKPQGLPNPPPLGLASVFIFAHGWKNIPTSQTPNYGQNIPFVTTLYTS